VADTQQAGSEAEIAAWYAGKSFSSDWTSWHFHNWTRILKPFQATATHVVEIGSWEGRSALFFMNYLPRSRLVCIDTFAGGEEHQSNPVAFADELPEVEKRFDANLAAFATRIEKIKAPSCVALPQLGIAGRRFDIAYIDGSHLAADVYSDATLMWPMMLPGGIVIFDDYEWEDNIGTLSHPKVGIDCFLDAFSGQYRIVHKSYQIMIEKTKSLSP
jgi:hypothetical protein